jgi:hypothetical protein
MRRRKTEAVTRRADVKTLASDLQVHLISRLSWQMHTYNQILAACRACSLDSHLKHRHSLVLRVPQARAVNRTQKKQSCPYLSVT